MRGRPLALLLALGTALPWASRARADDPWGSTFKNHLSIAIGFGYGTMAGGSSYDNYVGAYNAAQVAGGWKIDGAATPSAELHASLALTYYAPYYITVRTGPEIYYFQPTESGTPPGGSAQIITNYGGTVAIPILVGPHISFADDKLVLELLVGPTFTAYTSAGLNASARVDNKQLNGDFAVGVDSELGLRYIVSKSFSVGFELGYTSLMSAKLHTSDQATPYTSYSGQPDQIDFSGFRGVIDLAILAI